VSITAYAQNYLVKVWPSHVFTLKGLEQQHASAS